MPSWDELAKRMVEFTYKNKEETKILNYASKLQLLSRNYDPKKSLTVSYELHKGGMKSKYLEEMRKIFDIESNNLNEKGKTLLKHLISMNASFVTTNYDNLIEECRNSYRGSYKSLKEFNKNINKLRKPFVLHLHGSADNPEDMIFTIGQYHKMYRKDEETKTVFKDIFSDKYTTLFIGYGLNDMEIVEYLIDGKLGRYFILEPYTQSDKCLIKPMKSYYKSINVKQIPYYIDENGFETLVEVIEEWAVEFNKRTKVPAQSRKELNELIDEGYSDENSERIKELLTDKNLLYPFIKKIERRDDYEKWIESLEGHDCFDSKNILNNIKNDDSTYLVPLECLIALLKNKTRSNTIKRMAENIIADARECEIEKKMCNAEYHYHRLCESLILYLPKQFNETAIAYFKKVTREIDPSLSNILSPLVHDTNIFKKYKQPYQILFLKMVLDCIPSMDNSDWRGYWFDKFYENTIIKLGQPIQSQMYEPLLSAMIEFEKKNVFSFADLGSVEKYCMIKRTDDSKKHLIQWFCMTISYITGDVLKDFVKNNLHSNSHLLHTLALHAINLRYDELKDYFWEIENYFEYNYSELYELIKNNIHHFTKEEILKYTTNVENSIISQAEEVTDMVHLYRRDLIELIPSNNDNREKLLSKYFVQNSERYARIENRGKLIYTSNWSGPTGTFNFDSIEKLIKLSKNHIGDVFFTTDMEDYVHKNADIVIDNIDKFVEVPPELHHVLYRVIERATTNIQEILEFYKVSLINISNGPTDMLNGTISSLETFIRINEIGSKEIFDFVLNNAEKKYELYSSTEPVIYDDHILTSLNNWYISQLRFLLSNFGYDIVEPNSKRIIDLIECLIKSDIKECRLLIKIFIAYYSGHIIYLDKGWVVDNCKELFIDENSTDIIESLLLSGHCTPEIFDVLISENIFDKLIKKKKESFIDHMNSLEWMGADLARLYIDYDSRKYEDIIKKSINSMEHCNDFLLGVFTLASHEYESPNKKEKIETLIQMIIDSLSKKTDITGCQLEICKYISKAGAHNPQAKELLKKYSETRILDLRDEMVQTIMNMPAQYIEEQAQITLNLTNSPIRYYPDNFKELVIHLKSNDCNEKTFIEICNTMGSKGYEEYYKYLIE